MRSLEEFYHVKDHIFKPPRIVIISALPLQLATIEINKIIVGLQKKRDLTVPFLLMSCRWHHV